MQKIRMYIQCRRFFLVLAALCLFVLLRMFSYAYVTKTGVQGTIFNRIAGTVVPTDDEWVEKYPFANSDAKIEDAISAAEKTIEAYCVSGFPGAETINKIVNFAQEDILRCRIGSESKGLGEARYIKPLVSNVIGLNNYCADKKIPFSYYATPMPQSVIFYAGGDVEAEPYIYRSKLFFEELTNAGIDRHLLAKEAEQLGHTFSFDQSSHWYTADALFAAGQIAKALNQDYGFHIDLSVFEPEKYRDLLDDYPEQKNSIAEHMGYEYDFMVPIEDDAVYEMSYAEGRWVVTGSFQDVFVRPSEEWRTEEREAYHNLCRISNSLVFESRNLSGSCEDKKILMIGDSFGWPVVSYLCRGIREVTLIHNASFAGSLESYIDSYAPDAVLIMYNDIEFSEVYSEDAFYLR